MLVGVLLVCFCDRYFGNISHLARNAFSQMRRHQRAGMESRLFRNQNYFGIKAIFFENQVTFHQQFSKQNLWAWVRNQSFSLYCHIMLLNQKHSDMA